MRSQKFAIIMTIAALLLIISVVSTITPENAFAYKKNQATSQTSACGNEFMPINVGCQSTDSEIQGDENSAALTAQQTFPEAKLVKEPSRPQAPTLNVFKEVRCPSGFACPASSEFTINVAGNNPDPISFPGSSRGTPVSLGPGMYEVTEIAPETPTGLTALPPVFSPDCSGDIQAGQELSCTITNQYIAIMNVGNGPVTLEYSPATESIYVVGLSEDVIVIDSNDMVAGTVDIGNCDVRIGTGDCTAIEYSPATESIYVANFGLGTVTIIDSSNTVLDTVDVGSFPMALEYSPATESIYVATRSTVSVPGTVIIIDSSNTVVDTVDVGDALALEYSPATGSIYVANRGIQGTVSVIDSSNTVVDTIDVGSDPISLEYSPTTKSIYVANSPSDTVSVIGPNDMVVDTIDVGIGPISLEYSPATKSVYVANSVSGTISVIGPNDMVADTIDVSDTSDDFPIFIEYSPDTRNIYVYTFVVSTSITAKITVIDSNDIVIDTIDIGDAGSSLLTLPNPYEYLEYSPTTNNIYAVSRGSNDVIIIPP